MFDNFCNNYIKWSLLGIIKNTIFGGFDIITDIMLRIPEIFDDITFITFGVYRELKFSYVFKSMFEINLVSNFIEKQINFLNIELKEKYFNWKALYNIKFDTTHNNERKMKLTLLSLIQVPIYASQNLFKKLIISITKKFNFKLCQDQLFKLNMKINYKWTNINKSTVYILINPVSSLNLIKLNHKLKFYNILCENYHSQDVLNFLKLNSKFQINSFDELCVLENVNVQLDLKLPFFTRFW